MIQVASLESEEASLSQHMLLTSAAPVRLEHYVKALSKEALLQHRQREQEYHGFLVASQFRRSAEQPEATDCEPPGRTVARPSASSVSTTGSAETTAVVPMDVSGSKLMTYSKHAAARRPQAAGVCFNLAGRPLRELTGDSIGHSLFLSGKCALRVRGYKPCIASPGEPLRESMPKCSKSSGTWAGKLLPHRLRRFSSSRPRRGV